MSREPGGPLARYRWAWGAVGLAAAGVAVAPLALRRAMERLVGRALDRLFTEPYHANLWELMAGFGHQPVGLTVENALRATEGRALHRPIGPPLPSGPFRGFPGFSGLRFRPAQLVRRPLEPHEPVETALLVGPRSRRPLRLEIPILLGAMGYGVAVSEPVALALARGSALAGTACNTGNGPLLSSVRREARAVVVQCTGMPWTCDPQALVRADMVEIRIGRGAWAGAGQVIEPEELFAPVARRLGVRPGQAVTVPTAPLSGPDRPKALAQWVERLREQAGGVPVGVKLAAGHDLEGDLDAALEAGVDFLSLDAAEAGTHESPAILQDDFGLPAVCTVCRARRHLDRRGAGRQVTLVVGGGLRTPGDCLKALALGADGVYLGSAALFALTNTQIAQAVPGEPPTQLTWASGSRARSLDWRRAADDLANFLKATVDEMVIGCRALGKGALREVNADDLVALDPLTAAITGVALAY